MAEEPKMSLGLRESGLVVHIRELDKTRDRGLKCCCKCAACGRGLVAKMGDKRQHHFAHEGKSGCTRGDESALHLFAKEVFKNAVPKQFKVPEAGVAYEKERMTIHSAHDFPYDEVALEQGIGDVVPDITLKSEDAATMLIEIWVTHKVDEAKEAKLKSIGLPCIEIDLSAAYRCLEVGGLDREGIKQLLINGEGKEKKWLWFPDRDKYEEALREKVRQAQEQQRLAQERARLAQDLERNRQAAEILEEERRINERRALLDTASQRKNAALADHPMWKRNSTALGIQRDNIPYYLNVPTTEEFIFTCHRTIWQSTLFISCILNQPDPAHSRRIPLDFAVKNLREAHPEFLDAEQLWVYGDSCVTVAVKQYFRRLVTYGFVRDVDKGGRLFECVRSKVVALPPEFNNPRYRPLENGIFDTVAEQIMLSDPARQPPSE